jgi:hypothetical protein
LLRHVHQRRVPHRRTPLIVCAPLRLHGTQRQPLQQHLLHPPLSRKVAVVLA